MKFTHEGNKVFYTIVHMVQLGISGFLTGAASL